MRELTNKFVHREVEAKWQKKWLKEDTYSVANLLHAKKKFYNLMMFPYPSAEGLHAGNMFAFTGSDVYGRFKRMQGYEVLEPIGLDGFGIHSENYALKVGKSPQEHVKKAEERFYQQLHMIGNGFDWPRKLETYDPGYYKWTQWFFIQMFKTGLAYRKKSPLNFCPSCKTVLSDEQAISPKQSGMIPQGFKSLKNVPEGIRVCERCGTVVEIRELEQWFFRITDYADKLLEGLTHIDWPEKIKIAQRNWIGRKDGILISYKVKASNLQVECWTSRPDTNFGATFIVLSPEHPLALALTTQQNRKDVLEYIRRTQSTSKEDRKTAGREKSGVFTGSYVVNPLNNYEMPIWISDFVLMEVGTGAVIGVPGHDLRDFQFAKKFDLPIKRVVVSENGDRSEITKEDQVQEESGKMINSDFLNGLDIQKAITKMMDYFEEKGWGKRKVYYHLRDWTVSRQRYWGPPIPMIYCDSCAKEGKSWFENNSKLKSQSSKLIHSDQSDWNPAGWFPEEKLPVELPVIKDYMPKGEGKGPLADHAEFSKTTCPECGGEAKRETDVSDTFLDSSWYQLRYPSIDIKSSINLPFDTDITKKWLPVDLYFGGAEHAVLHLMYSRFVTMVLNDLGLLGFSEPFPKFYAHGLMIKDGAKMSKSKGNVVNPDEYIDKFGADTLRLYLMFMGPMDGYPDFRDTGIEGMRKFIERVWDLFSNLQKFQKLTKDDTHKITIKVHQTVKKVSLDIENFRYNTAISAIMEFVNLLRDNSQISNLKSQRYNSKTKTGNTNHQQPFTGHSSVRYAEWDKALETLALLLAPFAPHITEEIWVEKLHKPFSIHKSEWPEFSEKLAKDKSVAIVVQINGRLRSTFIMDLSGAQDKERVLAEAKSDEKVAKYLEGKVFKNVIFVPGKLVNFVLK